MNLLKLSPIKTYISIVAIHELGHFIGIFLSNFISLARINGYHPVITPTIGVYISDIPITDFFFVVLLIPLCLNCLYLILTRKNWIWFYIALFTHFNDLLVIFKHF